MTSFTKPTKPRGWSGNSFSRYWTKATLHGVKYMCTDCGRETLGYARNDDRRHHWSDCPRISGPRKEWHAFITNDGTMRIERLNTPSSLCHETREAALLALDAELAAQHVAIARQREQLSAMLREPHDD